MTYKNGIDDIDDLPDSASIGDTYIFTHIDGALLNG
jgi:hypothetical protein